MITAKFSKPVSVETEKLKIRIVIGCHSYLLGEGIKRLFKENEEIEVVAIFDEALDVREIIKLSPDILLTDFPIFRGFPEEFPEENKIKVLLIGDCSWFTDSERQIPELLLRGVYGVLAPDADSESLLKAVMVVYSGELWLDRKLLRNALYNLGTLKKKIELTKKEKEIVALICHGYRNKEIGQKLDISEQTVKSHCNRIFKKVGVSDRLQLALYTHKLWPGHF